ncbi:hypothetical protein ACU8NU_26475 (plasmid) [Rhizobium leguminosarum]
MKLLFFDRSVVVMVLKRLTEDRFRWPRRETGGDLARRISERPRLEQILPINHCQPSFPRRFAPAIQLKRVIP